MQIQFQTKEQSNIQQVVDFLKLSKPMRFFVFIELSKKINVFPSKSKLSKNNNFIIDFSIRKNGKLG